MYAHTITPPSQYRPLPAPLSPSCHVAGVATCQSMCYAVLCCTASCYAALFCAMRRACMPCCVGADEGLTDAQRAVMEPPYHGPVFTDRPLLNDDGQLDERSQKLIAEKGWDGIGGSLESDPFPFLFLPFIVLRDVSHKEAGGGGEATLSKCCLPLAETRARFKFYVTESGWGFVFWCFGVFGRRAGGNLSYEDTRPRRVARERKAARLTRRRQASKL